MTRTKLMVAGPTEIEDDILAAGSTPMAYNRTPAFGEFMLTIEEKLKNVFRTGNDVFVLASSGTGAMEASIVNLLSRGDLAIVVSGGTFGRRWAEIAAAYGIHCDVIDLPEGKTATADIIAKRLNEDVKAVFVTANETSTGVLTDLQPIGEVVKNSRAVLVVDAVSSLCADPLETDAWHCDVVITSSQKALALPPGLSFITLSAKAWRLVDTSTLPKFYFDLKEYRVNLIRGQTPFTPAISLLRQLDARLDKIINAGLDNVLKSQREKSVYLRRRLTETGLTVIGDNPSNGVIGVLFPPDIDAYEVVKTLRADHGIEITPSPGNDKHRIARIGLFGNIQLEDIEEVILALGEIVGSVRDGLLIRQSKQ